MRDVSARLAPGDTYAVDVGPRGPLMQWMLVPGGNYAVDVGPRGRIMQWVLATGGSYAADVGPKGASSPNPPWGQDEGRNPQIFLVNGPVGQCPWARGLVQWAHGPLAPGRAQERFRWFL